MNWLIGSKETKHILGTKQYWQCVNKNKEMFVNISLKKTNKDSIAIVLIHIN